MGFWSWISCNWFWSLICGWISWNVNSNSRFAFSRTLTHQQSLLLPFRQGDNENDPLYSLLLVCTHLDKLKAEWKAALSYTFQRCIEDKQHLNCQAILHNRGRKTEQHGRKTDRRACVAVVSLLASISTWKTWGQTEVEGKTAGSWLNPFVLAWDSCLTLLQFSFVCFTNKQTA